MSTTPFDLSGSGSVTVSGWYDREHRLHLDCEIDNLSFNTYNEYEDVDVDEAYVYDELESVETDIKEYLEKHNIDITQYEYATFHCPVRFMNGQVLIGNHLSMM